MKRFLRSLLRSMNRDNVLGADPLAPFSPVGLTPDPAAADRLAARWADWSKATDGWRPTNDWLANRPNWHRGVAR